MSRIIEHTGKVVSRGSELMTGPCSTLGSLLPFTSKPHSLNGLKVASRGETTGIKRKKFHRKVAQSGSAYALGA